MAPWRGTVGLVLKNLRRKLTQSIEDLEGERLQDRLQDLGIEPIADAPTRTPVLRAASGSSSDPLLASPRAFFGLAAPTKGEDSVDVLLHWIDRTVEGFHARVVQHEVDHLDGILYPQRVRDLRNFGFEDALAGQMTPMPD